jgi:serine/threonine-protein kinase
VAIVGFHIAKPFSSSFSSMGSKKHYLTADGLNGLLGEIRNHFGDTMGYKMVVYSDYAIVDRADPENNRYAKSYIDRSGKWSDFGPSSKPDSDEPLIDLTKLDVAAVTAALPGAAQKLGITNVKSTYLIFDAGGAKLYVSDGVESGFMEFNPDGSVGAVHPPS